MVSKPPVSARSLRAFGIALVASIAFAGLAAANASALSIDVPEKFQGSSVENSGWSRSTGEKYTCNEGSSNTGKFITGTSGEMTLTLKGCGYDTIFGRISCTTPGQPQGTIKTSTLAIKPVYLDAAHTKFGLLLSPPASGVFAEFTCGGTWVWKGSLIGQITKPGLNVQSTQHTLVFGETGPGVQQYQQIEGSGPVYNLTQGSSSIALRTTQVLSFATLRRFLP